MMTGNPTLTRRNGLRLGVLVRAILAFLLGTTAGRLALYLAAWQPPVKYASLVALLLALGLTVYGVKWVWQWLRRVSFPLTFVFILLCYLLAVVITGLETRGQPGLPGHWLDVATRVPMDAGRTVYRGALALVQFPGRFLTEFSGPPAVETTGMGTASAEPPVPANAPVAPIQLRITPSKAAATYSVGDAATTTDQAGRLCQMDAFADGPFTAGTRVRLVEGPRFLTDEKWWRVRSEQGSGWCPGSALQR